MRWLVPLIYLVLAAATATAAALAGPEEGPEVAAVAAEGGFTLANSGVGAAIFTASGIGPGDGSSGTVELEASGGAAELTLSQRDLADTPGLGGGLLSAQLQLRIRELGGASVYSGPLAAMPPQRLGRLEPGAPRSFEFEATLPEAGAAVSQNAVQGAATSVTYAWTASEAGDEPPGENPSGGGGGGDGGGPGPKPPTGEPQPDRLDLAVTRVRHRIVHGRLLVWTSCDHPCRVTVRGKLRARDGDERRAARVRFHGRTFEPGPQRLRIKVPRKLGRWLAADPSHEPVWLRATFVARDPDGDRDRVRRVLRLRSAR